MTGKRLTNWEKQKFSFNRANEAEFTKGLRGFAEYRDLGISEATGGQINAHVIRIKKEEFDKHHTTGMHRHLCDFQMNYLLKGSVSFVYEGEGEITFNAGDSWIQPAGIIHDEIGCSDDVEILEIYSPAIHETERLD